MADDKIRIRLSTQFAQDEWDIEVPPRVNPGQLIQKFIRTPAVGLSEHDAEGRPIDYKILWREGARVLSNGETLQSAGVLDGNQLVIQQDTRAGAVVRSRDS